MKKRDIGKEIIQGLEEIKAWKRGGLKLRTLLVASKQPAAVRAAFASAKQATRTRATPTRGKRVA